MKISVYLVNCYVLPWRLKKFPSKMLLSTKTTFTK